MFDLEKVKSEFQEVEEHLVREYRNISTGRANPALLDVVKVESYGVLQPLKNIASITTSDARTLMVSPWDKGQIKDIERAILETKLPFSVSSNDTAVIVNIPQLTEEGKKELVKLIKEKLEQARVRVRGIRQDKMKEIDTLDVSEDEQKRLREKLQELVDEANKKLEEIFRAKEKDIMSV